MTKRSVLRMVAPSLAMSVLLLALGGFSGWYVQRQQRQASAVLTDSVDGMRRAVEIVSLCREARFHLNQFALTGASEQLEAVRPILGTLQNVVQQAHLPGAAEDDTVLIRRVRDAKALLERELEGLDGYPESDRRVEARRIAREVVGEQMLAPAQRYLELSDAAIVRSSRHGGAVAGRVAWSFPLLGVSGLLAGLLAGYAMAQLARHRLLELHVPIRTASGKLEEVIGPIDIPDLTDTQDLDTVLECLADRIGVVVDRLRRSQLDLLRAEQLAALGQLAAGLAHELRNPLTAMKILVQSAAEGGEASVLAGRDVAVLEEELSRVEKSLDKFLDFARPPKVQRQSFDIRAVVQAVLDVVAARATRQGVELRGDVPDVPVEIKGDRDQIRQLLLNTVLNSLDALPEGGKVAVELRFEAPARAGGDGEGADRRWVLLRVSDNGPGIPEGLGERVFEPFVSTKETGLGLGLAICRQIVDAHKGEISAANTDRGGAQMLIRLPAEGLPADAVTVSC